jgi:hypothetical protein
MADFKLRAPPRVRFHGVASFDGVFGAGGVVPLAGDAVARAVGQAALLRGINLAGAGLASSQATAALLKGVRLGGAAVAGASATGSLNWVVGPIVSFLQGTGGSLNLVPTGPAGYTLGGVYGVDPLNTSLPSLITLSEAGMLQDGGSAVTSSNAIFFTYHEPGALPTLTLHPTATGTFPYHATVYPVEGALPAGQIFVSPDDANLRGSVLSAWPDGSAQVIVVAGETAVTNGVQKSIRLRPGAPSGTALTASRIDAIVTDIVVNFGGGDQTLSSFTSPARTWWANSATICCRYVLSCGLGTMRAIIDIHAFKAGVSDRAFVEVVIENGEVDANQSTVTGPTPQTYTGATVKVNGATIATVSSPTASMSAPNSRRALSYQAGHRPFRAWYCNAWVGLDPGLEVTHDTASLQAHPWFYRPAETSTENLATKYAQSYDAYVPWALCRLRIPDMDDTGDDEQIGLFTEEQSDYVLSGSKVARRAVLATGLACLSANFNWRHTGGEVPTPAQMAGKNTSGATWPADAVEPGWGGPNQTNDGSHLPSVALVPFLCRPSPCFIEIAQKETCWNHTNFNSTDGAHNYDQLRSRGWRQRNYATTAFLTPDADTTRKAAYRAIVAAEADVVRRMLDKSFNLLAALWEYQPEGDWHDQSGARAGYQSCMFQHGFVGMVYAAIARSKVLRGAAATTFDSIADRVCELPVRWINDATGNAWRALAYQPTIGTLSGDTLNQGIGSYYALTAAEMTGTPPTAAGPFQYLGPSDTAWGSLGAENSAANSYSGWFWFYFCAAIELDVQGASNAWDKVFPGGVENGAISNFSTWRQGYRTYPRFNRWPRNK